MLKRKYSVLIISVLVIILSSCSSSNDKNKAEAVFIGSIVNIEDDMAIVAVEEGELLKSGGEVAVDLSVAEDLTLNVLDRIEVGYDGEVRESSPLGINTTYIELLK